MEKVLVTGAYGFLGRYVVKEMREHGYRVIAFGRDPEKLSALKGENIEIFRGDFCDPADITKACEGVDYVIHCGALLKGWGRREDFIRTNVEGTRNVLDACEKNHVKRLVYTSSPSVRPLENNLHLLEKDYNENNRLNYYIESKILAEKMVRSQTAVPFSAIRPRGLCGIGDRNMLPVLIRANNSVGIPMFRKGEVMADLCCIENVALALRLCMEKDEALGQIYHITNDEPRKMSELAKEMFTQLHMKQKSLHIPFGAAYAAAAVLEGIYKMFGIWDKAPALTRYNVCTLGRSQVFDITKAKTELGYRPKVTISDMIRQYAEAYFRGEA